MVNNMKVRRLKVPNKKENAIIDSIWKNKEVSSEDVIVKKYDKIVWHKNMSTSRCISKTSKLSPEECIERNKKYFEKYLKKV